jgi:PadR family transcriptional regulator, regulatory protein PadR
MGDDGWKPACALYKLTAAGRKQLVLEVSQFERVMGAIGRVIQTA